MKKLKCVVFGGAGFIGKNVCETLINTDCKLSIYDLNVKKYFNQEQLKEVDIIQENFFEDNNLNKSVIGQDVVIHLISSVNPMKSMQNPVSAYRYDVIKTVELLEACREEGVKRVIFISSGGTVYGNYDSLTYSEEMPTNPINHYGIMKLSIEKILLMYNQLYDMENIILRVSNPYGIGQNPNGKLGAISVFTDKIINNVPIHIYGDGEQVRDYIAISDLVQIIIKSMKYDYDKSITPVFNAGSGAGTSLNELIKILENILNKKAEVVYIKDRGIDVRRNVLSMKKTQNTLEYTPSIDLIEGIREYIRNTYTD